MEEKEKEVFESSEGETKELEKKNEQEEIVMIEERDEKEKKQEDSNSKKEKKEKNKNSKKKIIIFTIILIVLFIILSTIFALINMNNDRIVKGVLIAGVDVSNLSEQEAKEKLEESITTTLKQDILMEYKDYNTSITPEQLEVTFKTEKAVQEAEKIGKTNNILIDNYSILKSSIFKTNIDIPIEYNEEVLEDIIKKINTEIPDGLREISYEVNKKKLKITKGTDGYVVKKEALKDRIIKTILIGLSEKTEKIVIPVEIKKAEDIDIEKIYNEIHKEAKDAYIEEKPFKLHVEEEGLDFAITMEEAKKILEEDKETYEIPLKIIKPKVKVENLGDKIFKQTLSKFTTIYDAGNTSRGTNISIAARTINGTIILPGETFSYNGILGNTTKDKGYQLGGAYVNGKVVPAYGGGICQVSSTLYNAVLYANLEVVERYNHSYAVSYVPAGRDATVSYGGKDFKFKNNRTYPIKIVASGKNGVISVSLKGIKEEKEYDIKITSQVLSTTPYETTYQENSNLAEGKQKVIQVGHTGLKSKAYKIVMYNGKTISKTLLSSDTYKPMNRIIEKGTKKVKKAQKEKAKKEETKIEEAEVTENED